MNEPTAGLPKELLIKDALKLGPQVLEGEKGPGLILRGESIHSVSEPALEAEAWAREALAKRESDGTPKLALIFGLGLGWHIRRLKELFPDIKVLVFEPSRENLDVFSKYNVLSQSQTPEIFLNSRTFDERVAKDATYGDGSIPLTMVVPGYAKAFPKEASNFISKVASEITRLKVIIKTKKATSSAFLQNFIENAKYAPSLPDLMLLKGRFVPRAAFVVGAGPSLSQNGALLKGAFQKGLVIAAAAALKPLLKLGVSPDVVIVIESSDTSRFLKLTEQEKAVLKPDVVLAAALGSHPEHFLVDGFKKSLFHLSGGQAQLLSEGFFLPQGGNAGTAAFALAYVWGLAPIILVGQDQAYQGSQLHAEGVTDGLIETERPDSLMVPAIGGGLVESNSGLVASINWLVEAARLVRTKSPGVRLFNSSAQGASVQGFLEVPLDVVLTKLGPAPQTWGPEDIIDGLPRPKTKSLKADLKQMSAVLTQVRQLANKNLQRALIEMMNLSKASAFLGEILAPALAGGTRVGVLKNIAWADGVLLKLLASLDKAVEPK
jgi:hypothetical protein